MTWLRKLLRDVNGKISKLLNLAGVSASPNTLLQWENAILGHNPSRDLARVANKYLDITKPSVYKNYVSSCAEYLATMLGLSNLYPWPTQGNFRKIADWIMPNEPDFKRYPKGKPQLYKKNYSDPAFRKFMDKLGMPFDTAHASAREYAAQRYALESNPRFKHHEVWIPKKNKKYVGPVNKPRYWKS